MTMRCCSPSTPSSNRKRGRSSAGQAARPESVPYHARRASQYANSAPSPKCLRDAPDAIHHPPSARLARVVHTEPTLPRGSTPTRPSPPSAFRSPARHDRHDPGTPLHPRPRIYTPHPAFAFRSARGPYFLAPRRRVGAPSRIRTSPVEGVGAAFPRHYHLSRRQTERRSGRSRTLAVTIG